jgi:hypothetical protein
MTNVEAKIGRCIRHIRTGFVIRISQSAIYSPLIRSLNVSEPDSFPSELTTGK